MTLAFTRNAAIDICVPVYNASAFVDETLQSILAQDFSDFNVLISVDQSNDESARICRRYEADKRVRVYEHARRLGYVGNSNFLMCEARAPLMKFALHDDLLFPDEIGILHEFMTREPGCSIAIPGIIGFGENSLDFDQHEVRGPALRRMLDIIMNQRSAAAFHGLVRIDPVPALRPMLPNGYLRDCEADVYWMAMAALAGELRHAEGAMERKRFLPSMTSLAWCPQTAKEGRELLVQHTARLTELAFTTCQDDPERNQVLMAALVRLRGEGLNWGVPKLNRARLLFNSRVQREFIRSLSGPAAEFARNANVATLLKCIENDRGVVGASRLARQYEKAVNRGRRARAEAIYNEALEMDPLAGWLRPFPESLDSLAVLPDQGAGL
jgi:glycosyltransferase involved in cell wall biosynthesis